MNIVNLQTLFGLGGILLSFSLVYLGIKKKSPQNNRVAVILFVLAILAFVSSFLNFIPTTSANNIRVDLVFVDLMFYPMLLIVIIFNLFSIRKNK